jgi:hypothetical protein
MLIKFYPVYIQAMFMFAQHKLATEKPLIKEEWELSPGFYEEQLQRLNDLDEKMKQFVELLKGMAE